LAPLAAKRMVVAPEHLLLHSNYIAWNRRLWCGRSAMPTESPATRHRPFGTRRRRRSDLCEGAAVGLASGHGTPL
jgi:hypothetical protein